MNETKNDPTACRPRGKAAQLSQEERDQILELRQLYGSRQIALRVGLSRRVVRRVLCDAGPKAKVTPRPKSKGESLLDPFREVIRAKVQKRLTVTRILREIRDQDYRGGRTLLAKYVRALRADLALEPRKKVTRRFETPPSLEMQIDWSPYRVLIGGVLTTIHVLGVLLAYSRKLFLGFYRDERQHTLLEGLACAFEYFDGCAFRLVLDNMSTAVLGRIGPDRKPLWHPRFKEFCRHYGCQPVACRVRDPNRKGKKEKSFRLVFEDHLKGSEYHRWEDVPARAKIWLDGTPEVGNLRVHGTTRQVPNEAYLAEHDLLIRLPSERFPVYEDAVRIVDQDSTISVAGTRYTVPATLACSTVSLRLYAHHFEVVDHFGRIAFSRRHVDPVDHGKLIIDPTHYACLKRRPRNDGTGERLDEVFVRRFPSLRPLVDGLKLRMKTFAHIHLRALVRLADRFGEPAFLAAADRAQQFRRFDAHAVERILELTNPLPPDELLAPLNSAGPVLLGEVEPASLDGFDHLDDDPASEASDDNNGPKEGNHGA